MKNYEELSFRDDFMFGKVMEDKDLCRDVLSCLLQEDVGNLNELQTQSEFKYTADGKPIRLDVYNVDATGNIYDAEMQNLNKKNIESLQLPKRSRFYQSSMDVDFVDKGNSYKLLPNSTVLFICTFDPIGDGLSQYTFRESCVEKSGLYLQDGTTKIFYNCTYTGADISDNLRKLYDYVLSGKTDNDLTKRIECAVNKGRKNAIWRTQYMKEWVIIQDAREEGGDIRDNERIRDMLHRGKSVDEIVDFCGYPFELVKKIEDEMLAKAE